MKRSLLTRFLLLATILLIAAGRIRFSVPVHAQQPKMIPAIWGTLKGGSGQVLYFEDQFGTVRIYDASQKRLIDEIRRN